MYLRNDTIIAPATAVGVGSICIIRLSGSDAYSYLTSCFTPASGAVDLQSHRLVYGSIYDEDRSIIDRVMVVYMRAPASFTREDVIEVHCHANPYVVKRIIHRFSSMGARLAEPGEFSYRAFMNGRIDLSEAEAISELIEAGSDTSARIAVQHLEGSVSTMAHDLKEQLIHILTLVEAYLDFPEDEVEHVHMAMLEDTVDTVLSQVERLLSTFRTGRVLREGLSILILGKPNVGKSSILNYLLGRDRAIVTEIPGTTRDFIEEHITLGHLPVKLVDTAGIRDSVDLVEQSGVKLALDKIKDVDLVMYVVDGTEEDMQVNYLHDLPLADTPYLLVINKSDRFDPAAIEIPDEYICVSATTGYGMDLLKDTIESKFAIPEAADSSVITEERHFNIFVQVQSELCNFREGLAAQLPGEFLACHIRDAVSSLGRITGETVPEDILNNIFSKFCVGK